MKELALEGINQFSSVKSLRNGKRQAGSLKFQHVACACAQHKNLPQPALLDQNNKILCFTGKNKNLDCHFIPIVTSQIDTATTTDGTLLLAYYQFFSQHHNWRVRAAVAVGICRYHRGEVRNQLLEMLIRDRHYAVNLAVVQALIDQKTQPANVLLQRFAKDNEVSKRARMLITNSLKKQNARIKLEKELGPQTIAILKKKKINYWSKPRAPYRNHPNATQKIFFKMPNTKNWQALLLKRHTKNKKQQSKRDYAADLFSQAVYHNVAFKKQHRKKDKPCHFRKKTGLLTVQGFHYKKAASISTPKPSEIYWAVAQRDDPKLSRPVLVLEAQDNQAKKWWVIPLTSQACFACNTAGSAPFAIKVDNVMSYVQLQQCRLIEKQHLIRYCMTLPEGLFSEIQQARQQLHRVVKVPTRKNKLVPKKMNQNRSWSNLKPDEGTLMYTPVSAASAKQSYHAAVAVVPKETVGPILNEYISALLKKQGLFKLARGLKQPPQQKFRHQAMAKP